MQDGVEPIGYCAWSFTDILSWLNGYQKRYGFVYVDQGTSQWVFVASRRELPLVQRQVIASGAYRPCNGPGALHLVLPNRRRPSSRGLPCLSRQATMTA